jgi:hypothetical protein
MWTCLPRIFNKLPLSVNRLSTAVCELIRTALGLETLTALDIVERVKFRGLLIHGDLPQAYLDGNIISVLEQLTSIAR